MTAGLSVFFVLTLPTSLEGALGGGETLSNQVLMVTNIHIINKTNVVTYELSYDQFSDSRWPAVWRSMVFPGWGQMHRGRRGKGVVIATMTASLLGLGIGYMVAANGHFTKHVEAQAQTNAISEFDDYLRNYNRGIVFLSLAGVFYVYNIFDAYWERPVTRRYDAAEFRLSPTGINLRFRY